LRAEGEKVGFVRLKWFRPFPTDEVRQIRCHFKTIGVVDRNCSFGSPCHGGVVCNETRSALYHVQKRPIVVCFIARLGGREITMPLARQMSHIAKAAACDGRPELELCWLGVRE